MRRLVLEAGHDADEPADSVVLLHATSEQLEDLQLPLGTGCGNQLEGRERELISCSNASYVKYSSTNATNKNVAHASCTLTQ